MPRRDRTMVDFRQMAVVIFCAVFLPYSSAEQADRVIAVGGSLTEIIYALDAADRLIAVDSTSLYPTEALERFPNVGYMRNLSAEPVLSMAPDLILAVEDAGPPEVLKQIRSAGVRVMIIPDEPSIQGIFKKVRDVAGVVGLEQRGERLISDIEREYRAISGLLSTVETRPRVLFLLSIGRSAPLAAGSGTSADSMIRLAQGDNVMGKVAGYKTITPEAIIAAAPEIIVVPEHTFARYGDRQKLFSLPELAATPAARENKLLVFDGLYLVGFGPRTVDAIRDLAAEFHPELFGLNALTSAP